MNFSIQQLNLLLLDYKYLILFPLSIIEGPIIAMVAGFLCSLSQLNFVLAYVLVVAGDLIGDSLYYLLGFRGKGKFIVRWGKFIGITSERILNIENHFRENSGKTLVLGKLLHGVGTSFLIAAGLAGMPFGKFLWYNFLATIPKSLILMLIGFYFGLAISKINTFLDLMGVALLGIAGAFILYYLYHNRSNE